MKGARDPDTRQSSQFRRWDSAMIRIIDISPRSISDKVVLDHGRIMINHQMQPVHILSRVSA